MSFTCITRQVIGPVVFLWALTSFSQEPTEYIFCSYNLKNWLSMERYLGGKTEELISKPVEERTRLVEMLTDIKPDVLGVCEIGTDDDVADLKKRLKSNGIDLPFSERTHGGDHTRSLALLSRFPISKRKSQTDLKYLIGEETFPMQRGILDVSVQFNPELEVRFLGVHLKSKRAIPEADEAMMRRNEAHLLRNYMDSIFDRDIKVKMLAYGDFNEHRNEPAIAEIIGSRAADSYMTELPVHDADGLVWTHFWDAADVYSRLDFLFSSRALRPHIDLRKAKIYTARDFYKASDHRPLVITISPR